MTALARTAAVLAFVTAATPAQAQSNDAWWARDKALHFGASAGLAAGGYAAAGLFTCSRPTRLLAGGGLALGLGTAKEIADRYTGGDPSMKDLTWDVIGTATGLLVALVIDAALATRTDPALFHPCAIPHWPKSVAGRLSHNVPFALKQGIAQAEPFNGRLP